MGSRESTEANDAPEPRSDSQGTAAGPSAAGLALTPLEELRIDCLKSALYHDDRENFYARLHKLTMLVAVLSSASAFAFIADYRSLIALVTVAGVIDLVFDVSGKARLHATLRRGYYNILALAEDDVCNVPKLRQELIRLYADEPPIKHAVNTLAYNAAMKVYGRPERYQFPFPVWKRALRNCYPFTADNFKTYEEIESARSKPPRPSNNVAAS